jgi:transcriptional antiterminator NusG
LTEAEMMNMGLNTTVQPKVDLNLGETVMVTKGVWQDTTGVITAVNDKNQTVTINIDMFGRETPVEISFTDVKKL